MSDRDVERAIDRSERAAARWVLAALRRRLGLVGAARVVLRLAWDKARGEPFSRLGPPCDLRDRLSRRQAADVVLLDRALRRVAVDAAEELVRGAVLAGAIPFLEAMVPALAPERLAAEAEALAARFFNAEGTARLDGPRDFRFEVTRCRFVELLGAVGASHLVHHFCEADHAFFDGTRRPVRLVRLGTLATGATRCDFRFHVDGG